MDNQNLEVVKKELPTLDALFKEDALETFKKQAALDILLNQPPPAAWIKEHPTVKCKYLPIDKVEYLLTRVFLKWRLEVKTVQVIANSVCVTVRLHYQDITTGEWDWQDGIGAAPMQTNAGAGATDFNQIKSAAVQMAAPAAESYAMKDAAEKLGKLFGKDLNRKDEISYDASMQKIVSNIEERAAKILE